MRLIRVAFSLVCLLLGETSLFVGNAHAATFGTAVPVVGGVTDMVLDSARNRLYLVGVPDKVDVYSVTQRRTIASIKTDSLPLAAAMSRDGKYLYVVAHNASALNIIDLESLGIVKTVNLPARPEGVAVGNDERVLISTIGTGAGNAFNVLLLFDPNAAETRALSAVQVTPPASTPPVLPAPQGQPLRSNRSFLAASNDGTTIVGANVLANGTRTVFIYEVASGSVLRSRNIGSISNVLSISTDGQRFMAGLSLFDTASLEILAQQNLANAPYPIPTGTNFNLQQNQGGSAFAPDNSAIFSAFNVAPQQNPASPPNISQLMLSDPDNLLIRDAYQLPENLSGKILISADSQNMFAISESGFLIIPIGQVAQQPIATLTQSSVLLANDQCGVFSNLRTTRVSVRNDGRGTLGATSAQLLTATGGPAGLGGAGGAGGGIVIPVPGGGIITIPIGGQPGQPITTPAVTAPANASAPTIRTIQTPAGVDFELTFNQANRNAVGTVNPFHDYLVQSNNAINIPARIRVFQNNRDSDARGEVIPVPVGISSNEALADIAYDTQRQRVYMANSGLNRIEVYDIRTRRLLAPVKVGQLPRSMTVSLDGSLMYVANSGGESVTVIDLDQRAVVGKIKFPPIPLNASVALATPRVITASQSGPLVLVSTGSGTAATLWKIIGNEMVPRRLEPEIFGTATTIAAPYTMTATPNGEFVLLLAGNGFAYLYSAVDDRFVQSRQIFTNQQMTGYYGAVAAGPRGTYYVVNGTTLNSALSPMSTAQAVAPGANGATGNLPVAATIPVSATIYARFTQPFRTAANQALSDPGTVELVDVQTGAATRRSLALEGPTTQAVGNQRVVVDGRTMVLDATGANAYIITTSGLSIVPLDTPAATDRPLPNNGGTVSLASYLPAFAPGGLISIFGRNLASDATAEPPYPTTLGGTCVTLNNTPIPLIMTSAGQINARIPENITVGTTSVSQTLVVRSVDRRSSSTAQTIRISRLAPALFVDTATGRAAAYDGETGDKITPNNPTTRDRYVSIYGVGFGLNFKKSGATVMTELADKVEVFIGDPKINEAEMDVRWAGLVPGLVGIYQVNFYVPWYRLRGEQPLVVRVAGVESQRTGPVVPKIDVD